LVVLARDTADVATTETFIARATPATGLPDGITHAARHLALV